MSFIPAIVRRAILPVLGVAAGVALAWGGTSYLRLVRLEVRIADASARVEASSRSRVQLVENLIHCSETYLCLDPARRSSLRALTERIEQFSTAAVRRQGSERYRQFLAAQRELTAALDGLWPAEEEATWGGPRRLSEDLRLRIDHSSRLVGESIRELESSLASYRRTTSRLPYSLLAGLPGSDAEAPIGPWVVAGAVSDPPVTPNR